MHRQEYIFVLNSCFLLGNVMNFHIDFQKSCNGLGFWYSHCHNFYHAMRWISGTSHGPVSGRLSVRPSQVRVLLKRLNVGSHKKTPHDSPGTLVFRCQRSPRNRGVGQNQRLSTNKRLYLENGTRQTHGFY